MKVKQWCLYVLLMIESVVLADTVSFERFLQETPPSMAPTDLGDVFQNDCGSQANALLDCVQNDLSLIRAGLCLRCLYREAQTLFETYVNDTANCVDLGSSVCDAINDRCLCGTCANQTNQLLKCETTGDNCTIDCTQTSGSTGLRFPWMGLAVLLQVVAGGTVAQR